MRWQLRMMITIATICVYFVSMIIFHELTHLSEYFFVGKQVEEFCLLGYSRLKTDGTVVGWVLSHYDVGAETEAYLIGMFFGLVCAVVFDILIYSEIDKICKTIKNIDELEKLKRQVLGE